MALLREPFTYLPFVSHVLGDYARWEEENHPQEDVRCGLSAKQLLRVWELGMSSMDIEEVRAASMTFFAYSCNRLRESSVASILVDNVELLPNSVTARRSVRKGRQASSVPLGSFTSVSSPVPMDLWRNWHTLCGFHPRFFALTS